jgi:hypothetical protein
MHLLLYFLKVYEVCFLPPEFHLGSRTDKHRLMEVAKQFPHYIDCIKGSEIYEVYLIVP